MGLGRRSRPEARPAPFLRKEIDVARNPQAVVPILMPPLRPELLLASGCSASLQPQALAPGPVSGPAMCVVPVHKDKPAPNVTGLPDRTYGVSFERAGRSPLIVPWWLVPRERGAGSPDGPPCPPGPQAALQDRLREEVKGRASLAPPNLYHGYGAQ